MMLSNRNVVIEHGHRTVEDFVMFYRFYFACSARNINVDCGVYTSYENRMIEAAMDCNRIVVYGAHGLIVFCAPCMVALQRRAT